MRLRLAAVAAVLVLPGIVPGPAPAIFGGPDRFGYSFADSGDPAGPAYDLEDIAASGTILKELRNRSVSGPVPIGFTFTFYGLSYENVYVADDGFITFDARGSSCCPTLTIPSVYGPDNLIALSWRDLDPASGGGISYRTLGEAPARRLIVQYTRVAIYGTAQSVTMQVKIFEADATIEVHYKLLPAVGPDDETMLAGIENASGEDGLLYLSGRQGLAASAVRYRPYAPGQRPCPEAEAPPPLAFDPPVYIDSSRAGGEPVSVVAQDGSIIVSAHAGTTHLYKDPFAAPGAGDYAIGYFNQTLNWRSADGGRTWRYIGLAGQPVGPHSATSTGFSDPDLTIDAGGRIYNTEIDLLNVSVFSSPDDGQSFPFANPIAASGDRPWLTGQEPGEVFLFVQSPAVLLRSTDGGLTFVPVSVDIPAVGKLLNDPLNPEHGFIGADVNFSDPLGFGFIRPGIAISGDDGATWERHLDFTHRVDLTGFWGAVAVDRAGWIYTAAAAGYQGGFDSWPDGSVAFNYFDRSTREWGERVTIPTPPGNALWAWAIGGDDGRVAVVWIQTLASAPEEFYVFAAYTMNAHGTPVVCLDGHVEIAPPRFEVVNASGRPIHVGNICLEGLTCNTNPYADRRLGDFITANIDLDGTLFITSADTMLPNPLGGPKPVSNPIFIKQTGGAGLATPTAPRPTRCLYLLGCG